MDRIANESDLYTVRPGDSLSSIAAELLHDRGAWLTLWKANRDRVRNPHHLQVGTQLRLPSQAALHDVGRGAHENEHTEEHAGEPTTAEPTTPAAPAAQPAQRPATNAAPDTRAGQIVALYAQHGELIRKRAGQLGIEPAVAAAIVVIESSGSGFRDGRLVIRFEPGIFRQLTGRVVRSTHRGQDAEYAAFAQARTIDEDAAYRSISMGAGQLMGFNAESLDYKSAAEMMRAFERDEGEQITAMLKFIENNPRLVRAARDHQWATFARIYNGPKQHGYAQRLARAFETARRIESAPEVAV